MNSHGMVYIFTGDGKGKTSAALGVGLRASLAGLRVAMIQWYKSSQWDISEHRLNLPNFTICPMGQGFYFRDKDHHPALHRQAAAAAIDKANQLLPQVDVLILDEINNALADKLIDLDAVLNLIAHRGSTHLILTGRDAPAALIDLADLVSSITKIKHPYDSGRPAVKGLDF